MVVKIKRFINKLKMKKTLIVASSLLAPALLFAQYSTGNFGALLVNARQILNTLVPLLISIAIIIVIWGAIQFIAGAGDPEKRKIGRDKIIWGIVGVAVIIAVWGLVNFLLDSFTTDRTRIPDIPSIPALR